MRIVVADGRFQRVDCGIAGHIDLAAVSALAQQICLGILGRSEIILRDDRYRLTVELLRKRTVYIIRTKSRLYMTDRYLQIKAGERGDKGRGGITVYEHRIRLYLLEHRLYTRENIRCDIKEGLSLLHYREIVVGDNIERLEHLIEHLSVLPCHADDGPDTVSRAQLTNKGTHLYSFRSCTENEHYCFHCCFLSAAFFCRAGSLRQLMNKINNMIIIGLPPSENKNRRRAPLSLRRL